VAHTYTISSATYVPGSAADPQVTVVGTVDGVAVTIQLWLSAISAAFTSGGVTAVKNLVAGLMLAQSGLASVPTSVPAATLPTGSFSQ
jgi:hypothetical protein